MGDFRYHGGVIDAFIPIKKNKEGKRFRFVRFNNMTNARRAISRLSGFVIIGNRLSLDLVKFKGRRQIWEKKS